MALAIRLALLVLTPVFIILRIVWLVLYMVYRTWSPADSDPVNPGPLSLKLPGEYAHLAAPHGVFEVARGQHGLAGNPSDQRAYAGLQLELVNDPPLETRIAELVLPTLHWLFVAALWTFLLTAR